MVSGFIILPVAIPAHKLMFFLYNFASQHNPTSISNLIHNNHDKSDA